MLGLMRKRVSPTVQSVINDNLRALVEYRAFSLGLTVSEYLKSLIEEDVSVLSGNEQRQAVERYERVNSGGGGRADTPPPESKKANGEKRRAA